MSSNLFWAPPPVESKDRSVGLKYEIAKFIDPEWNGGSVDFGMVGDEIVPFLKGILACSPEKYACDAAKTLIAAIEKYGEIQLYIQ